MASGAAHLFLPGPLANCFTGLFTRCTSRKPRTVPGEPLRKPLLERASTDTSEGALSTASSRRSSFEQGAESFGAQLQTLDATNVYVATEAVLLWVLIGVPLLVCDLAQMINGIADHRHPAGASSGATDAGSKPSRRPGSRCQLKPSTPSPRTASKARENATMAASDPSTTARSSKFDE